MGVLPVPVPGGENKGSYAHGREDTLQSLNCREVVIHAVRAAQWWRHRASGQRSLVETNELMLQNVDGNNVAFKRNICQS